MVRSAAGREHRATYPITGPAAVTHAEIAEAIAAARGRAVTFVDVPPETFGASLRGLLPDWQVDGLLEDYAHYSDVPCASAMMMDCELLNGR
jgi:uncharacterized protein YbjT (DUF2867 family)